MWYPTNKEKGWAPGQGKQTKNPLLLLAIKPQFPPLYLVDRASLMHGQPNIKIKVRGFDYVDKKITVSEPVLQ